jgi:glycosyltransferase involved in cell wall biosynthesis
MNLLVLDQFSELGGAQQCLLDLLPAMRARGWRVTAGVPGDGPLVARLREGGCETAALDCGPYTSGRKTLGDVARFFFANPRLARQIGALAGRVSPDLIYVNGPRLLPAVGNAGRPVVFHSHSIVSSGSARALCGAALRRAPARVIATCRFVGEQWKRFADVTVVYNGVTGLRQSPARAMRAAPVVGCIGRIAPEKGQLEFVKAAAIVHRELPECRFVIYGAAVIADPAYEREVRGSVNGLPIEFAGWTSDVYAALADIDLLLVPSAPQEATTRVIPEAFAARVPVIAFASGGIPEIVEHGRTGFLATDASEMARLAIGLLCDAARGNAVSEAAHRAWETGFTLEKWQAAVLDFLTEVKSRT